MNSLEKEGQREQKELNRKILSNSLMQFSAWGVRLGVTMLVNIGMVRLLGPQDFGHFSYVHAFVLFLASLTPMGLQELVVHELLRDQRGRGMVIYNVAILRLGAALLACLLTLLWALTQAPGPVEKVGLILLSFYFFPYAAEISELWFQSRQNLRQTSVVRIVATLTGGALAGWGIWHSYGVIWFYQVVLAEVCVLGGGLAILLVRDLRRYNRGLVASGQNAPLPESAMPPATDDAPGLLEASPERPERPERAVLSGVVVKELLQKSWPLWLAGVALAGYSRVDQLMLGELTNSRELGFYAAAVRLSLVWSAVPYLLMNAIFPAVSEFFHQRSGSVTREGASANARKAEKKDGRDDQNINNNAEKKLAVMLQSMFDALGLSAWILVLPVTFLSHWIIRLLYGDVWVDSAQVLAIHIWINIFVFTRTGLDRWLVLYNKNRWSFVHHGLTFLLNVLLNLYFIPRWGALGAAWASLIAIALASGLLPLFSSAVRPGALMMIRSWVFPLRYGIRLFRNNTNAS